jgi:hypothetical protein
LAAINRLAKTYSTEEISARLGKSETHIRQLRKLNNLSSTMKKLFNDNAMVLSQAFVFAQFSKEIQDENIDVFQSIMDDEGNEVWYLNYTARDLKRKIKSDSRNFELAPFDITDKSLGLDGLGSCTKCKYNSTTGESLFEDNPEGRCLHPECFEHKIKVDLANKVKEAKKNHKELVAVALHNYPTMEEYAKMPVYTMEKYELVTEDEADKHSKVGIVVEGRFGDPSSQGNIVFIRKRKTPRNPELENESPMEALERKMDTRHERASRKAGVSARFEIFKAMISEPEEKMVNTILRAPILDNLLEIICSKIGDQKILRTWLGLDDRRLENGEWVAQLKKADQYPNSIDHLAWFIVFTGLTEIAGTKYDYDSISAKDSFIKFANEIGVDTKEIITEVVGEVKEQIKTDKKELKDKKDAYEKVEDMYAELVQSDTPVALTKHDVFRASDTLPNSLDLTKKVCRKYGVKIPATATTEELHKDILDRFNELRRRSVA